MSKEIHSYLLIGFLVLFAVLTVLRFAYRVPIIKYLKEHYPDVYHKYVSEKLPMFIVYLGKTYSLNMAFFRSPEEFELDDKLKEMMGRYKLIKRLHILSIIPVVFYIIYFKSTK